MMLTVIIVGSVLAWCVMGTITSGLFDRYDEQDDPGNYKDYRENFWLGLILWPITLWVAISMVMTNRPQNVVHYRGPAGQLRRWVAGR